MLKNPKMADYPYARALERGERATTNGPDFCLHGTPMSLGCTKCDDYRGGRS